MHFECRSTYSDNAESCESADDVWSFVVRHVEVEVVEMLDAVNAPDEHSLFMLPRRPPRPPLGGSENSSCPGTDSLLLTVKYRRQKSIIKCKS